MGYKVVYDQDKENKYPLKRTKQKSAYNRAVSLVLLAAIVACLLSPAVTDGLKKLLLPGDYLQTEEAAEELIDAIRSGQDLQDAITAFCREIIDVKKAE